MEDRAATLAVPARGWVSRGSAAVASRRADIPAIALYVACTALFFWQVVALGLVPAGYDLLIYFYPYKAYVAELLRQGQLPLWNPLVYMGVPLLGNVQIGVLYPPNLLFYLFSAVDGLRYSIVLHTFLAGVFTYLFARISLGLSPTAAWLSGALFAFGGFIGGRVGHLNILHSAVWLPLLLLFLEQAVARRSLRLVGLGAVVYALQILAGHTQEVYTSGLILGLFALYLGAFGSLSGSARGWPLGAVAGMAVGAAALTGVQLIPAMELTRESYRSGGVPFPQAVTYSVPVKQILNSILPFYAHVPYIELGGYVASASLPLIPAALAWKRRPSYQWFFAALALLSLLLALGDGAPVYGWFYRWVPGFDLFRAPGRWLFTFSLSWAILAGIGMDALGGHLDADGLRRWLGRYALALAGGVATLVALRLWLGSQGQELYPPNPQVVLTWALFSMAGMAAVLVLASRPRFALGRIALLVVVLLELYLAKEPMEYNLPVPPSLYTAPPPLSSLIPEDPSFRVLSLAKGEYELSDEARLRAGLPSSMNGAQVDSYLNYTRLKRLLPPDVGMVFGLNDLDGSDGGVIPTRQWAELKRVLMGVKDYHPDLTMRSETGRIPDSRTLGALGVRYLVLNEGASGYDSGWQPVEGYTGGSLKLLRNSAALPRAYVVHDVEVLSDDQQLLESIPSRDLQRTVLLSQPVDFQKPSKPGDDRVTMVEDGPNEVTVDVTLGQPGFLVLADSYYPGWNAYLDGRETTLLRADYAVRAVQLPAGSHRVRFSYEPLSLKLGLGLTVLGLAALVALLLPRRLLLRR